jgi:hypothetical protein
MIENAIRCASEAQECNAADGNSGPLLDPFVLRNVLSYVGSGHHLYVALVNKQWQHAYATLEKQATLYSSAFASPSTLELAHKAGLTWSSKACQRAAGKHADVATLAAAHMLGLMNTGTLMNSAAQCNKLAEVQYLYNQGCPWPLQLLERAAKAGHYELLRWCYEQGCRWHVAALAPVHAAECGNVDMMAWILQQPNVRLSKDVMSTAAAEGHTALCQYLHEQQCPWDTYSVVNAAFSGHLDLLMWLMDNGCPWYARFLRTSAARGGSLEVMAYLQQQGILTSVAEFTDMLNYAAKYDRLDAAKWLRSKVHSGLQQQQQQQLIGIYGLLEC